MLLTDKIRQRVEEERISDGGDSTLVKRRNCKFTNSTL